MPSGFKPPLDPKPERGFPSLCALRLPLSQLLAVDLVLEHGAGSKLWLHTGLNLNAGPSRGVAPFPCGSVSGLKGPKTNQRHFLTIGNGIDDGLNQGIECLLGVGFGQTGLVGKGVNQFGFVLSGQCLVVN